MQIRITAAVIIIGLLPLAACGSHDGKDAAADCPSASPTSASSPRLGSGPTPWPSNHGELAALQAKIESLGQGFAEVYAGSAMDTDADRVFVWRKPSADFDRAVADLGSGKTILICAPHSAADLIPIAERLARDYEKWAARGLLLHSIWARHDGMCVEVGTQEPSRARTELRQEYPSEPLCFVEGSPRLPFGSRAPS